MGGIEQKNSLVPTALELAERKRFKEQEMKRKKMEENVPDIYELALGKMKLKKIDNVPSSYDLAQRRRKMEGN